MRARAIIPLVILFVAVLAAGSAVGGSSMAQEEADAGLALSLRAERYVTGPGESLPLVIEVANVGEETMTLVLGCEPQVDVKVYDREGALVWQRSPDCAEVATTIALGPGHEHVWRAEWPGEDQSGQAVERGVYYIYGVVHTLPEAAVVGPLTIEVGDRPEASRTPDEPDPSETPRHPEPTRAPAESGPVFPITDSEGRQVRPDVAGHPELDDCQNLVVWWDETEKEIWGRFVEREWRGEPFKISGDLTAGWPKVAYNHHRRLWLVVFTGAADAGGSRIRGRYVQCAELEGPVFTIGENIRQRGDHPVVAPHGEHFAVAWRRELDEYKYQIVGVQVTGIDSGQYAEISDDGFVYEPAIDCEGRGDCLVAWSVVEGDDLDGADVVGRYWFPREEYVGERLLQIAATENTERYPSVAWNSWHAEGDRGAYAVTWTHPGPGRTGPTVRARTVYPGPAERLDGYVVGSDLVVVSDQERISDHGGDVAALGPDFVAVWSTGDKRPVDIRARRLLYSPESRSLSGGVTVVVGDHDEAETYPAVASALDPLALAVWNMAREGNSSDIIGRHVALHESDGGRVVLVGSITGGEGVLRSGWFGSLGSARSGVASPGSSRPDAPRFWQLNVNSVTEGAFSCEYAVLQVADGSNVDDSVRLGDIVSVAADHDPAHGACALSVGPAGTYIEKATTSRIVLPETLQRRRR